MNLIDIYNERTLEYMGSFEKTNENIIDYVASIPPHQNVRLVEYATDDLVLTTIGNFLDYVPNQEWLKEILPKLIKKQQGEVPIEPLQIVSRYE